jgi:hypothetical protein
MMADLLDEEAVALVRPRVFVRFPKQRVKRLGYTSNGGGILGSSKGSNVEQPLGGVGTLGGSVDQIGVFHVLCHTLEQGGRLVEGHG